MRDQRSSGRHTTAPTRKVRRRAPLWLVLPLAFVLLLGALSAAAWKLFVALPPQPDALKVINAVVDRHAALRDEIEFESEENAWHRYRVLLQGTLGMARPWDSAPAVAGNEVSAAWREFFAPRQVHLIDVLGGSWDDPALDLAKELLVKLRPALDGLDHAASAKAFRPRPLSLRDPFAFDPDADPATNIDPKDYQSDYRQLARLNEFAMRSAANEGDWEAFIQRVTTGLRHARLVASDASTLAGVVAASIDSAILREIRFTLLEHEVPPGVCASLRDLIESESGAHSLEWNIVLESAMFTYYFSDDQASRPARTAGPLSREYWELVREYPTLLVMRDARRYYREAMRQERLTPTERLAAPQPDAGWARGYVPAVFGSLRRRDSIFTSRVATKVMLELETRFASDQRHPDSLTDAIPAADALDPVSGQPFVYVLREDGSYELHAPRDVPGRLTTETDFTAKRGPVTR